MGLLRGTVSIGEVSRSSDTGTRRIGVVRNSLTSLYSLRQISNACFLLITALLTALSTGLDSKDTLIDRY